MVNKCCVVNCNATNMSGRERDTPITKSRKISRNGALWVANKLFVMVF